MIYIYKVQKYFSTEIIIGECKNIYVQASYIYYNPNMQHAKLLPRTHRERK